MNSRTTQLTGRERTFAADEIIVSKTSPTGHIIYANEVFVRVSGYTERELLGKPHSILRHPSMPRGVFKLLWDTIQNGQEIFAYVLNRAKNGDEYWVFAHVTPTFDEHGRIIAYHSNRRLPSSAAVAKVKPLYDAALRAEKMVSNPKLAAIAGLEFLASRLAALNVSYEQFVFSLDPAVSLPSSSVQTA